MNNIVVETLIKEREKLILAKEAMVSDYSNQISEIEAVIERLEGKKVWETENKIIYDDENPHYIKSSIEEI